MPQSPLPPEPENSPDRPDSTSIRMRWKVSDDPAVEPLLLEISVDGEWAATELGGHLLAGIVDIDLAAPADIIEKVPADPPGTPVVLGAGQHVLRTCELGFGALFNG